MSDKYSILTFLPSLQLFADGGGAAAGGDGGAGASVGTTADNSGMPATSKTKGAKNPLAGVRYGIQDDAPASDPAPAEVQAAAGQTNVDERQAEFDRLRKGEMKSYFDKWASETIQNRLKGTKETVDKYNALAPTLELLGRKYGVDPSDIDGLNKALEEDDSYFEDEALEKGISVEQLKAIRKMERENADLKAQMREQAQRENADRIYAGWMEQADALTQVYPNFNLQEELNDPKFTDLLRNGIDVRTAFEVIHKDEILPAAMAFAQQEASRKIANSIASGQRRPAENGMNSQSTAQVKSDVTMLTKADRQEIARRVARGEKIRF